MNKVIEVLKVTWKIVCKVCDWLCKLFKDVVFNLPAAAFWILAYVVSAKKLAILPLPASVEDWLVTVALVIVALIAYDLSGKKVEVKK